jgi:iron complex transport system substrate-binding protein
MRNRFSPRTPSAILLVGVVLLSSAGCGGDGATSSSVPSTDVTVVSTAEGVASETNLSAPPASAPLETVTTLPIDDGRVIVALDEIAALTLLALEVQPDFVLTTLTSEAFAALAPTIDASTIEFSVAEPNFEQLASLEPDIIVGVANPNVTERLVDFEAVAPVVLAPLEATWQEQMGVLATEFDREQQARQVIERIEAEQTRLAADLLAAGLDSTSVSILTARVGTVISVNSSGATGLQLTAVGLQRPSAQSQPGAPGIPFVPVSPEGLSEHDGDVLLVARGEIFDVSALVDSPLYASLGAVQAGSVYEVVADFWVLGGSAFAAQWVLSDLRALLLDGGTAATLDDAADRWSAFLGDGA